MHARPAGETSCLSLWGEQHRPALLADPAEDQHRSVVVRFGWERGVTAGAFSFGWTPAPGKTYSVEASGNLATWTAIATNLSTGSFTESPVPAGSPFRYYRLRVE